MRRNDDDFVCVTVDGEQAGLRLDSFLAARFPSWTRSAWRRYIRRGAVSLARDGLDGGRTVPSRRLVTGDIIRVDPLVLRGEAPHPFDRELPVIFESGTFVAVNKPAGLLTHPAGRFGGGSLVDLLRPRFGELHLCGRLDRFTSGLVLFAREGAGQARFTEASDSGRVSKEYLALVEGRPAQDRGVIDLPVGKDGASEIRLKMAVTGSGKRAVTEYEVIDSAMGRSLLLVRLRTGRKHQIRVHLAAIGVPVVGDKLYGADIDYDYFQPGRGNLHSYWPGWHGLHCFRLGLPPGLVSEEEMVLVAQPMAEMAGEMARLGFSAPATTGTRGVACVISNRQEAGGA